MKPTKLVEGGWMHYLKYIRESADKDLTESDIKNIMKLYVAGVSKEEACDSFTKEG